MCNEEHQDAGMQISALNKMSYTYSMALGQMEEAEKCLGRYLSPPLFPVHIREMPCTLYFHELPDRRATHEIGEFEVSAAVVCHPDPTLGYRIASASGTLAYLPDHEPALGLSGFTLPGQWVSGYSLARDVDLLIHDAQYTGSQYEERVGWGHSTMRQAFEFAELAGAHRLSPFHHDPTHDDDTLDFLIDVEQAAREWPFAVIPGTEGATVTLNQ
jgi:ribonuclease BN (tRNA processing enzyme)